MGTSQSNATSTGPCSVLMHHALFLTCFASLMLYTVMTRRELANSIERIEDKVYKNDVAMFRNIEKKLRDLEKCCKNSNQEILETGSNERFIPRVIKRRKKRAASHEDEIALLKVITRLPNGSLILPTCIRGPTGLPGPSGPQGPMGLPGLSGPPGQKGRRGKAGPMGYKGNKGDSGMTGPKGSKGDKGDRGSHGRDGGRGPQGIKGQKGESIAVPKIIVPPNNQTAIAGNVATFTCEATGNPVPEISLMPVKKKLIDGRYKWVGYGMLMIENLKSTDEGEIKCAAKSVIGEDSMIATLKVNVPSEARIIVSKIETEEGAKILIKCNVVGNPWPTITWSRRSGKKISKNAKFRDRMQTIEIEKIKMEDSGEYVCSAVNSLANSTATANIQVARKLSFLVKPPNFRFVLFGQKQLLSCFHEGGVQPITVTWRKNGNLVTNKTLLSKNNQVMAIKWDVKTEENYQCEIRSSISTIQHSTKVQYFLRTCKEVKLSGQTASGHYSIYIKQNINQPVRVFCDMSTHGGVGVTVVSHDSEARTRVQGIEANLGYIRKIKYQIASDLIKEIVRLSDKCEQYIKYECKDSRLYLEEATPIGSWYSVTGARKSYWGGMDHTAKGCACKLTNSCAGGKPCNCDMNDNVWREDSGYLRYKEDLPISEVRFGDTGDGMEEGYYTVGKLRCY